MRSPRFLSCALRVFCLMASVLGVTHTVQAQVNYCTAATSYQYAPAYGRTYIGSDSGGRYVRQYMNWSNLADRLEWFKRPYAPGANFSAGTFEQDTFFYNYDGQAYGSAPSGYWSSDLPYPYVDTQAFDPPEEKAVTVGSAHAYNLGNNY